MNLWILFIFFQAKTREMRGQFLETLIWQKLSFLSNVFFPHPKIICFLIFGNLGSFLQFKSAGTKNAIYGAWRSVLVISPRAVIVCSIKFLTRPESHNIPKTKERKTCASIRTHANCLHSGIKNPTLHPKNWGKELNLISIPQTLGITIQFRNKNAESRWHPKSSNRHHIFSSRR